MNRTTVFFALVTYATLPLAAEKVHVDFDRACDFSHYQTYRWAGPPSTTFLNQLMQERVIGFIEEALAVKRLKRVEMGGALLINLNMNVQQQERFTTFTDTMGPGWGWGWGSAISTTTAQPILFGTLTIDLVDSRRNQLVFQGVSTSSISTKPEKNSKRLAKAVNEIFEKYPPR